MFFRKYFACVESLFPCVFCCAATWWLDRLFVELGHRASDTPICNHNDLQYVHWHQGFTALAVFAQSLYVVRRRRTQIHRECILLGVSGGPACLWHLYFVQAALCAAWSAILLCLMDVSPWLCVAAVLDNRATITLLSGLAVVACLVLERFLWDWTLQRALRAGCATVDI